MAPPSGVGAAPRAAAPGSAAPGGAAAAPGASCSAAGSSGVAGSSSEGDPYALAAHENDPSGGIGRRTAIDKARLQTFNFREATAAAVTPGAEYDLEQMSQEKLQRYISSCLRFVPVEVAMRYYARPLIAKPPPPPSDTSSRSESQRRGRSNSLTAQLFGGGGEPVLDPIRSSNSGMELHAYSEVRHEQVEPSQLALEGQAYEHPFNACVLFSDISGFTKLTNKLSAEFKDGEGAEILRNLICKYFEELISCITRHSGDVIKFAGDAVLSIWSSSVANESIELLTLRATACALEQLEKLNHWDTGRGVKLELHLGLGTGQVRGIDLGNHMRREYVVAGEPLKQLSEAEQQAESGELVVSPQAWEMIKDSCVGQRLSQTAPFADGYHKVLRCKQPPPLPPHWREVLQNQLTASSSIPTDALNNFYTYVPGPMRGHLSGDVETGASQFREVTMMFIKVGGLHYSDPDFTERFQRVVYMICSAVYLYKGSLSRVSIDDKGTCVKVTFGLPPLYHNDDPAKAVQCGLVVRDNIRPMRLKASIGITTGSVFIGYVGSKSRGEYTEYGVMVNMAARFMSKATNEVLVNETTYEKSLQTHKIDYDALAAVPMKGMDKPQKMYRAVSVVGANYYEPPMLSAYDRNRSKSGDEHRHTKANSDGGGNLGMVGRQALVSAVERSLHQYAGSGEGFVMVVRGAPGVGKTKLIEEVTHSIAPAQGVVVVEAEAESSLQHDHLYIWRQVFLHLPKILGALKADGGGKDKEWAALSRQRRTLYREWLYRPRSEPQRRRSARGSLNRMSSGGLGLGRSSNGLLSRSMGAAPSGAAAAANQTAAAKAASQSSQAGAPAPVAAAMDFIGSLASSAPGPERAKQRPMSGAFGGSEVAAQAQVERFKKHEALLNEVLDCDFAETEEVASLSEEAKKELTSLMLTHILANAVEMSGNQRCLVVLEDAQWIDSASWTVLHRLTEVVAGVSVLLTMASAEGQPSTLARTELNVAAVAAITGAGGGALQGTSKGGGENVELSAEATNFFKGSKLLHHEILPFNRAEVHELICKKCRASLVEDQVVDEVLERTSGNALYCIELCNTMLQRGVLTVQGGLCKLAIPLEELESIGLPNSLHAAMSMQLDNLTAQCAACMKAASVMGLNFPVIALWALSGEDEHDLDLNKVLAEAVNKKLIKRDDDASSIWVAFLDANGKEHSGGVYKFNSWMLQRVAYTSLPFEERRRKHLKMATWMERCMQQELDGKPPDTHLRLVLYPMLADHWMNTTDKLAAKAIHYYDEAARAALERNDHHAVITFARNELRLLRDGLQSKGGGGKEGGDGADDDPQCAVVQGMLAEAYLEQGKVKEAREAILAALATLDRPAESSREVLRKRFRYEFRWLDRPTLLKEARTLYWRKALDEEKFLVAAKLYEMLGRVAYNMEEMDLHDFAVLRCLNLAKLLHQRASLAHGGLLHTHLPIKMVPATEQLARAYAAACIVTHYSNQTRHDRRLRHKYAEHSKALCHKLGNPPSLWLYANMMFGLSSMREADWAHAITALREAHDAAQRTSLARRSEEVLSSLGMALYFSGKLSECHTTFTQARQTCLDRHDAVMLAKLTVGVCAPLLAFGEHAEASELLGQQMALMPEFMHGSNIYANGCGLLAMCHWRVEDVDSARRNAEEALGIIKTSGSSQLASFWGFAAAIEVLVRILATSTEKLDYDAASKMDAAERGKWRGAAAAATADKNAADKAAAAAANAPSPADAPSVSSARAPSSAEAPAPSGRDASKSEPPAVPPALLAAASSSSSAGSSVSERGVDSPGGGAKKEGDRPLTPLEKFRRGAKNVAKLTKSAAELDDASSSANNGGPSGVAGKSGASTRRRKSIAALALLGFSPLAQSVPAPSADQLSLACLIEALEQFERFAAKHVAARPRQLLYAGWLQRVLGRVEEANELMEASLRAAKEFAMPLDGALAKRELGRLREERGLLEIAFRELNQMEARVEADEAKAELTRLGFGLSTLDTSGGAGGKSGGGGGDKDSRRASLGLSALFGGGKTASLRSSTKSPANVGDSSSLRENSIKTLDLGKARAMSPANGEVVPPDAEDYNA